MYLKKLHINLTQMLRVAMAFVLFTMVGTLSHELGHIAVAEYLGYETTLHYGSMTYTSESYEEEIKLYEEYSESIANQLPFERKDEFDRLSNKIQKEELFIFIGGPLQTILTGFLGLVLIHLHRNRTKEGNLSLVDWTSVFLALFWLREVFNLCIHFAFRLIDGRGSYFGGDEAFISTSLKLWPGTISITMGLIGACISIYIVFKVIPLKFRPTFILGGLIGGITGYIIWMLILGPILLP